MYESETGNFSNVKFTTKGITVLGILSVIPTFMVVNAAYVDWHKQLIADVTEPEITIKLEPLQTQVTLAQKTASENSKKLDEVAQSLAALNVQSAVIMVSTFQRELEQHERTPKDTNSWRLENNAMKKRLETAKDYRDCLMLEHKNCDQLLRGW